MNEYSISQKKKKKLIRERIVTRKEKKLKLYEKLILLQELTQQKSNHEIQLPAQKIQHKN